MLFCLAAILFTSPAFADIYKFKEADGGTYYGDTLPVASTRIIRVDMRADEQTELVEKIHVGTDSATKHEARSEPRETPRSSGFKAH